MDSTDFHFSNHVLAQFRYLQWILADHRLINKISARKRKPELDVIAISGDSKKFKMDDLTEQQQMYVPIIPPPEFFDELVGQSTCQSRPKKKSERLDILGRLASTGLNGIIQSICSHLTNEDFNRMSKVSSTWKQITKHYRRKSQTDFPRASDSGHKRSISTSVNENENEVPSKKKRITTCKNKPLRSNIDNIQNQSQQVQLEQLSFKLLGELRPDRDYRCVKCPKCRRASLEDIAFRQGKCGYESCAYKFCTLCHLNYHPCRSCIDFNRRKSI